MVEQHTQNEKRAGPRDDPDDPALLSEIALSLSGGGLRATGYHLGALDCLDRLGLLDRVHILSSVSGGSLTATSYALCQQEGEGVQACFDRLYDFLTDFNTLEVILARVTAHGHPHPSGHRELITGMADVLQEQYFSKYYRCDSFGQFWERSPSHLREIMFNATCFKDGVAFRFQKSQFPCRIGNGHVSIDEDTARAMRMGDVMAASACIPSGMEPLFFPDDFRWPQDDEPGRPFCTRVADDIERQTGSRYIALMDGGIYDNEGVTSILLALQRRERARHAGSDAPDVGAEPSGAQQWGQWVRRRLAGEGDSVDRSPERHEDVRHLQLFIISDAPIHRDTLYPNSPQSAARRGPGWWARRTLGQCDAAIWVLAALMLLSAGDSVHDLWRERHSLGLGDTLMGLIPAGVCLLLVAAAVWLRLQIVRLNRKLSAAMPAFRRRPWHYLKKIRLGEALRMVELRVGSTVALTSRIFMNRIRQLTYGTVYAARPDEHGLAQRIMVNDLYTLLDAHLLDQALPAPTGAMTDIVRLAEQTRTALWLDPSVDYRGHGELDILVSAGQMSTCYNLLRHLRWRFGDASGAIPPGSKADAIYQRALALWQRLRDDPMCLVMARRNGSRSAGDGTSAEIREASREREAAA